MNKRKIISGCTYSFVVFFGLSSSSITAQTIPEPAQDTAPVGKAKSVVPGTVVLSLIEVTGSYKTAPKSDLANDPAANPASVTVIEYSERERRNTRDYADLLKPLTGVAANSFDQGGVGYGFTLRGFSERSNGGNVA